ncbi:transporter [Catalinimonas niigatensis]|uniref:transporter n=1 Tax=Catalinimonas niigatensis TaxID=1397264 RepID=UPI002665C69D|nr:transporter [Catalinimonas niigatensis]WPP47986.1 transporter [Catalinimonas niigatensis]
MKAAVLLIVLCMLSLWPEASHGQEQCMHATTGNLAPLGVMGSHTHSKGSWMFSYQLMRIHMQDNLTGRENIEKETILEQYMMVPASMNMWMHMLGGMYAVTDKLTLMGMLPYVSNQMEMTDRMGMSSEMYSSSLGDVSLTTLYSLYKSHTQNLQLNLGVSIPTGSIDKTSTMHHMQHTVDVCLPYMMQTGSGTWDVMPAIAYTAIRKSLVYGVQGQARLRTGENTRAYRLGNLASLDGWLAYQQNNWLSYSLRLQALKRWEIYGQDRELDPMMSPASNALNSGNEVVNAFVGTSCTIRKGLFEGHRLALEYGIPLYQHLNGIQMLSQNTLLLGWQASF